MATTPRSELTIEEQGALIETLGNIPLNHVVSGSVTVSQLDNEKTLVRWGGVAVIPDLQLESVLRVVAAEREAREAGGS